MTQSPHSLPNLIILGPQGSGKGTQAELLAERFGYTIIGMGQLLRDRAAEQDELGVKLGKTLAKGVLVSDAILEKVLTEHLRAVKPGTHLIFDGVPRDITQVSIFERALKTEAIAEPLVIYLTIPRGMAIERVSKRRVCEKCGTIVGLISKKIPQATCPSCGNELQLRDDDRAEAIETRLNIFYTQTLPVIDYYARAGRLIKVNAEGSVPEVSELIIRSLNL